MALEVAELVELEIQQVLMVLPILVEVEAALGVCLQLDLFVQVEMAVQV